MEENVLKDFATFNEFPDSYLEISSNCDYYFIYKPIGSFIARKKFDLVSTVRIYNKEKLLQKVSYYDVNDGSLILKTESISNLDGSTEEFVKKEKGTKIIALSSILDLKEEKQYLTKQDVKKITKEQNKIYTKSLKRH